MLIEMLEIVLTPKRLGHPRNRGALSLSLFSLMVNPRLPFAFMLQVT